MEKEDDLENNVEKEENNLKSKYPYRFKCSEENFKKLEKITTYWDNFSCFSKTFKTFIYKEFYVYTSSKTKKESLIAILNLLSKHKVKNNRNDLEKVLVKKFTVFELFKAIHNTQVAATNISYLPFKKKFLKGMRFSNFIRGFRSFEDTSKPLIARSPFLYYLKNYPKLILPKIKEMTKEEIELTIENFQSVFKEKCGDYDVIEDFKHFMWAVKNLVNLKEEFGKIAVFHYDEDSDDNLIWINLIIDVVMEFTLKSKNKLPLPRDLNIPFLNALVERYLIERRRLEQETGDDYY